MFRLNNIFNIYQILSAREQKIFVILALLGAIGFVGLGSNLYAFVTVPVPAYGGELREGTIGQPTNLNPVEAPQNDAEHDLRSLIHAGLLNVDQNGNYRPQLAESLPEVSEDLKTYTIKLRPNLKWQDGRELTAADVVYTVKNIQSKGTGSYLRNSFRFVTVEQLDNLTVRLKLRDASANFIENLLVNLLPAHLEGSYDEMSPVGAGPYTLNKFRYKSNREVVVAELESNPHYYPQPPYIDKIVLKFFPNAEALLKAYNDREIDSFGSLPDIEKLKLRGDSRTISAPLPQYQAVFFNKEHNSGLGSLAVRQALRLSANRDEIAEQLYNNQALTIGGPTVSKFTVPPPEFAPDQAATLLEEEGWLLGDDGWRYKNEQRLNLILSTNEVNLETAELLKNYWRQVGVDVQISLVSGEEFLNQVLRPRAYQAVLVLENSGHDPDPYFFWHSSQVADPGLNFALLRSNEIDKVIVEARSTANLEKREQLYEEFTQLVNAESVGVFLVQPFYTYITDESVKNVQINRLILPHERFANVHEWYIKMGRKLK